MRLRQLVLATPGCGGRAAAPAKEDDAEEEKDMHSDLNARRRKAEPEKQHLSCLLCQNPSARHVCARDSALAPCKHTTAGSPNRRQASDKKVVEKKADSKKAPEKKAAERKSAKESEKKALSLRQNSATRMVGDASPVGRTQNMGH